MTEQSNVQTAQLSQYVRQSLKCPSMVSTIDVSQCVGMRMRLDNGVLEFCLSRTKRARGGGDTEDSINPSTGEDSRSAAVNFCRNVRESKVKSSTLDRNEYAESLLPENVQEMRTRWEGKELCSLIHVPGALEAERQLRQICESSRTEYSVRERAGYHLAYILRLTECLRARATLENDTWILKHAYSARKGAGRLYADVSSYQALETNDKIRSYSVQGCPKSIRGKLCGMFAYDVDLVNSHPTIMLHLMNLIGIDASKTRLHDYVNFRSKSGGLYCKHGWIESVATFHDISETYPGRRKDLVKNLFLRITYGGAYSSWRKDCFGTKPVEFHPEVVRFERELDELREKVASHPSWSAFYEWHRTRLEHEDAEERRRHDDTLNFARPVLPRVFSLLVQTLETHALQVAMQVFVDDGQTITSIIHDGFHVLATKLKREQLVRLMRLAESEILLQTKMPMRIEEKEFYGTHVRDVEILN